LTCVGLFAVSLASAQPPQAPKAAPQITDKQLEIWVKQFPDADTNKDGKLTREEALAYMQVLQKKQAAQAKTSPPTHANVKYGKYARNVLDVWQAKSDKPAPVLINFHGGGFVAGDKSQVTPDPYVRQGITVVSANYRFVKGDAESAPYPAPMLDGARVVQFVRSKAKEWNIDPERIALTGGSAGAIISLWIAYQDDMAQPDSEDPIERQSTRVSCVVPVAAPTNLDPDYIREQIGGNPIVHPSIYPLFGAANDAELKTKEKQALIKAASPMTHVSKDDPPTMLMYGSELSKTPLPANTDINTSIHHPQFGVLLKQKLDAAGVENDLLYVGDGRTKVEHIAALQAFLQKHLIGK
jgi:acetyl esterase/lipase